MSDVKFRDISPLKSLLERFLEQNIVFKSINTSKNHNIRITEESQCNIFEMMLTNTHSDIILARSALGLLHITPFHNVSGKHGSPVQFLLTKYLSLIPIIASTSMAQIMNVMIKS